VSAIHNETADALRLVAGDVLEAQGLHASQPWKLGAPTLVPTRYAELEIPGIGKFEAQMALYPLGWLVKQHGLIAIIGQNILKNLELHYDGPKGTFELRLPQP
jgi:hypothetical protein